MARPHEHADERTGPGASGGVQGRRAGAPVASGDRVPTPGDGGRTPLTLPVAGKPAPAGEIHAEALAGELAAALEGDVRFDAGHRAAYARDASNYRQPPIGVVLPRNKEDVERAVAICRRHGVPVLGRGGGTSLAGQCCNVAVVLDFTRYMNRVLEVDPETRLARVEPGCVLDDLRAAAGRHGLTFGPDPATHDHCALGGMIGNNACGVHSVMAAWHHGPRTSDNLHRLEVLTYGGARFWVGAPSEDEMASIFERDDERASIHRALLELRDAHADAIRDGFPDIPRRVSGYNLDELLPERGFHVARALAGTESTCALFLEAEVHLIPEPAATSLVVAGYPDVYEAAAHVPDVLERRPIGLEAMDRNLIEYMDRKGLNEEHLRLIPSGDAFLLAQFGGDTPAEAEDAARRTERWLGSLEEGGPLSVAVFPGDAQEPIWEIRESGLGATASVPGMRPTWPGWEDSAVAPERLPAYLRELRALLDDYGYSCAFYGHFGQGLLHTRIDFDLETREGTERFMRFMRDAAGLVTSHGGSLSGEHGDGQARGALLSRMYGPTLMKAFRRFKTIWDPDGRMNPGKVIDAYLPDQNLALGPARMSPEVETWFRFPEDGGAFQRAARRCVGVGKCRRKEGGTMCPSYMVTLEEEHSTRGRARLLDEMIRGDVVTEGWRSDAVERALDLCLSCKGCKGDCPVHVDMATYKAEFRAHHYAGRLRPREAYAFGWIHWWARAAALAPGLANGLAHTRPFARLAKWIAGVHPERELPHFAPRTFRRRFGDELAGRNTGGRKVIFWADTFNDHFHPETAISGVRVLQALGYEVVLPKTHLCCGRPLYDYGFLGMARRLLGRILDELENDIAAGVPVVGVEPSCIATFRDELTGLFPTDERAQRLAGSTWLLGEFLDHDAEDVDLGHLDARALVHGHCHQEAVLDFGANLRVLERLGMDVRPLDSGCCGMAGPFGFEKDHYEVAQACGERVLLPAVRGRASDTWVITDGFSCRTQIEQNVPDVLPLNLADVVWRALEEKPPASRPPRQAFRPGPAARQRARGSPQS